MKGSAEVRSGCFSGPAAGRRRWHSRLSFRGAAMGGAAGSPDHHHPPPAPHSPRPALPFPSSTWERNVRASLCEGRLSRNPFLPFHPSVPAWMLLYCQGLFTGRVWLLGHTFHVEFTSWTVPFLLFIEHLGDVAFSLSSWFWAWSLCTGPPVTLRSARPILFLRVPHSPSAACYLGFLLCCTPTPLAGTVRGLVFLYCFSHPHHLQLQVAESSNSFSIS